MTSLIAASGAEGLLGAMLGVCMLAIAVADYRRFIIPDELTVTAMALALLRAAVQEPNAAWQAVGWTIVSALLVAAPLFGLGLAYRWWRGRDGFGLGDIKLAAVGGAWLDVVTVLIVIEFAALAALAAYFLNAAIRERRLSKTAFLPFGSFLAPAVWFGWLGEALVTMQRYF
jgi:leader peptidase (prepilin peptidase)/N-methyltransferase